MKKLFVLAGGFGTRLRTVVSDVPKPLAPVAGRPFLLHLIDNWVSQGVRDFVFLLHYEAEKIQQILKHISDDPKYADIQFVSVIEDAPLGTGGAILNAVKKLDMRDSFLVANADTWLEYSALNLANEAPNVIASVEVPNCQRYGSLDLDGDVITNFNEKSSDGDGGIASSGLYHLEPSIFDGFDSGSCFSLENDVFPLLVSCRQLRSIVVHGEFIDIGIPGDYLDFCEWMECNGNDP